MPERACRRRLRASLHAATRLHRPHVAQRVHGWTEVVLRIDLETPHEHANGYTLQRTIAAQLRVALERLEETIRHASSLFAQVELGAIAKIATQHDHSRIAS